MAIDQRAIIITAHTPIVSMSKEVWEATKQAIDDGLSEGCLEVNVVFLPDGSFHIFPMTSHPPPDMPVNDLLAYFYARINHVCEG